MTIKTFQPKQAGTVTIAVTTTSQAVALDQFSNAVRIRIVTGGSDVFFDFGSAATTATVAASVSMAAGSAETMTKGASTHIAAVCASGTATMYVTNGEGL